MTHAHSSMVTLTRQANTIAASLKAAERGEPIAHDPGGKIAAARATSDVTFGVILPDGEMMKFTWTWEQIRRTPEFLLAAYVLERMLKP